MNYPVSTGQVAKLLKTTEARVAETVRRGLVHPPPVILAGRRLWTEKQIRRVAEVLNIDFSLCTTESKD